MPFTAGQRLLASQLNSNMPQLLGSTILTGSQASISLSTAGGGTNALTVTWQARSDNASPATFMMLQFNGDTGNDYLWQIMQANVASTSGTANSGALTSAIEIGTMTAAQATANFFSAGEFVITNPLSTTAYKSCSGHATSIVTATNSYTGTYGGLWQSTAAITSITLKPQAGNFVAGTMVTIYGI